MGELKFTVPWQKNIAPQKLKLGGHLLGSAIVGRGVVYKRFQFNCHVMPLGYKTICTGQLLNKKPKKGGLKNFL